MTNDLLLLEFQGCKILELYLHGKRCWILSDIERVLGYEPRGLSDLIGGPWKPEFVLGKHHVLVGGKDLRSLRKHCDDVVGYQPIAPKTSRITVVYQPGLDLIALKTHKPYGQALRAYLVDHVMPAWRENSGEIDDHLLRLLERILNHLDRLFLTQQQKTPLGPRDARKILDRIGWAADRVFFRRQHPSDWRHLRYAYDIRVRIAGNWTKKGRLEDQSVQGRDAAYACVRDIEKEVFRKIKKSLKKRNRPVPLKVVR